MEAPRRGRPPKNGTTAVTEPETVMMTPLEFVNRRIAVLEAQVRSIQGGLAELNEMKKALGG